jgi:hypothetical protein
MKQPDKLSKLQVNQAIDYYEKLFYHAKTNEELNELKKLFNGNSKLLIQFSENKNQKNRIEKLK